MAGRRKKTDPNKDLLVKIRQRFKIMKDADDDNRRQAMDDMKFVNVPGEQWDQNMKTNRGDRPCYEFNKIRISCKRIINDMRANRAQGKVRGVEGGDTKTAEIFNGLIRNIWEASDGDTVADYAGEYQVVGGYGAWRINTEYSDDTAFDQDIVIEAIKNPFCLYADPAAQDILKRDAEDWILTEKMKRKTYETRWPKADVIAFDDNAEFDDDEDWEDDETVRIAEYWYKEPVTKQICMLSNGMVIDKESDEANAIDPKMIVRERQVQTHKIMMVICSGEAILEGPVEWAGTEFPFVTVYGEYMVIDGKTYWWGLPRFAKDAQRSYNISRTAVTEVIALAPQAKVWMTVDQAKGHTTQIAEAHKKNFPVAYYNADPKSPGPPVRIGGADVPIALMNELELASEEIKAVTGIFDASLGQKSNEQSGRAIYARQQQGEIATFNYQDNMAKAMRRTYEILIDLIPRVYDTERELRILGSDGAEDYVQVNQVVTDPVTGEELRVHDLSQGRYDVTVTVGPNFSTLRQESAEVYMQLAQGMPDIMGVAGDLIFKSLDLPYAEDIAERMRALLPPPIQQMLQQDGQSPEVQAAMAQAAQAMQMVQAQAQQLQQAAMEIEQEKSTSEKQKAEVREAMAKLETQQAKFEADVAKKLAEITTKQAQLQAAESQLGLRDVSLNQREGDLKHREELANGKLEGLDGVQQKIDEIDELVAQYITAQQQVLGELAQKTERPKFKGARLRREGGQTLADIEFDDGSRKTIRQVRKNGELTAEPVE